MADKSLEPTRVERAVTKVRNFAEDTLERVERRWDQAMDVIHARPIRDSTRDDALGGGEQFAAQARERLDYQLRHPGPGEIAERHADLAGDATVDKTKIEQTIRSELTQARSMPTDRQAERFDINAPWRENLPQVNMDWLQAQDTKQMKEDPGFRNQIDRASEERYSQQEIGRISWEVVGNRQILPFVETKEVNEMKPTLAEKKQADTEYWKGVISRDKVEIADTVQKIRASETNAEQPAEAAITRESRKATNRIAPLVAAAVATSFAIPAYAQDINFLEQASRARNETMHVPQQKPLSAQQEQISPTPGLTCAHVDQWQPVRSQPSDSAPVLGYTQAQIAVEGSAGGGYAHVRYYNGKEGYVPQTSLKPAKNCSVAGVRPNGGPVFQYKAG